MIAPSFPDIAARFYDAIRANPGAAAVLSGPEQVARLQRTLIDWMSTGLLGPHDDIARFEYLKKSARNFGSVLIGIETAAPEELAALVGRMEEAGLDFRDITGDVVLSEFLV